LDPTDGGLTVSDGMVLHDAMRGLDSIHNEVAAFTRHSEFSDALRIASWGVVIQWTDVQASIPKAGMVEGAIDAAISSGLSSAVYGTDFGSGFVRSFGNSVVNLAMADFQSLVGLQNLVEGSAEHMALHGLIGCVAAELSDADCAAGAMAGIAQSIYAGTTGVLERHINRDKHLANVEMVAALAAFFASSGKGANVSYGGTIGKSGFENNALCGGLCIAALIAAGYILGTGEGDPIEGLRRIGRGEDLLSELAGMAGEEALEFATDNRPQVWPSERGSVSQSSVSISSKYFSSYSSGVNVRLFISSAERNGSDVVDWLCQNRP